MNGVFGLKVPDANPYETVLAAMQGSVEALQEIPEAERAVVRPGCRHLPLPGFRGIFLITEHRSGNRFRQFMMPVMKNGSCGMQRTVTPRKDCLVQMR